LGLFSPPSLLMGAVLCLAVYRLWPRATMVYAFKTRLRAVLARYG
jgi:hypothetical protein